MQQSSEKLNKIMRLEVEMGHQNRAVVGGLQRLIPSWEADARAEGMDEATISQVSSLLSTYPQHESAGRPALLKEICTLLNIADVNTTATPRTPAPQAQGGHTKTVEKTPTTQAAAKTSRASLSKPAEGISRNPMAPELKGLTAETTVIRGVGSKQAELLKKLGLNSIEDMLYFYPRRYDDYSKLKLINQLNYGEEVTIIARVVSVDSYNPRGSKRKITEAIVSDTTASIKLIWFNQDWHTRYLRQDMFISISGKVEQNLGRPVMYHPDYESVDQEQLHTARIVPVYPLTAKITQKWLRKSMHNMVSYWAERIPEFLPHSVLDNTGLIPLNQALQQVHFPDSWEVLNAARHRLAFDEIFLLQMGVLKQKHQWQQPTAEFFPIDDAWLAAMQARIPFALTAAQQQAVQDLRTDLNSGHPMNRLLQGDVGSGKTIVAMMGICMVIQSGAQAAFMAPTSILAEQHYHNLKKLLTESENAFIQPDQIRLLIGDTPNAERKEIAKGLESGSIKLLIGTHALIEDNVSFQHLQMIVVDEQHRFGVKQRAALRSKGNNPHLLVMTATPIPRSLALTVYGDLDISVMNEMPAGRQEIDTHILFPRERERAYQFIRTQVEEGHQAFIIYPLVESGDREEVKAAVNEQERLQKEIFPDLAVGLMHGRLKPDEKDKIMHEFRDQKYQILVSTSVVEVGVDIPNATVIVIEGANRFGLAQLHQFRGRVGRSSAKSTCLLIPENENAIENERLMAMTQTNDGFVLAEQDLKQRGPGEFLGTRQSGYSGLKMASLTNVQLIETAREEAKKIFEKDPTFTDPAHTLLVKAIEHFWPATQGQGDVS